MMSERTPWWLAACATVALGAVASCWSARIAAGVLAGGTWHLASLWCLLRLLGAWLGPRASLRRAVGWLLVKVPLLYGLAVVALRTPAISSAGFGVGVTVVLVIALGSLAVRLQRSPLTRPHGS